MLIESMIMNTFIDEWREENKNHLFEKPKKDVFINYVFPVIFTISFIVWLYVMVKYILIGFNYLIKNV